MCLAHLGSGSSSAEQGRAEPAWAAGQPWGLWEAAGGCDGLCLSCPRAVWNRGKA